MKKTICKKLAAIVMTGVMAVSCLMPHMQVMAAQKTPAEGRMPLKGISYGPYYSEIFYLPEDAQLYYETRYDIDQNGYFIILSAYNDQNREMTSLNLGFEFEILDICTNYDEANGIGEFNECSLCDIKYNQIENHEYYTGVYQPDGRAILQREWGNSRSYQYDTEGRPISCTDTYTSCLYEYNNFGKLSVVYEKYNDDDTFSPSVLLTYDEKGNLIKYEYCYNDYEGMHVELMADVSYDAYSNPLSIRFYDGGYVVEELKMIY